MKKEVSYEKDKTCRQALLAIKDTMELLSGKWKIQIIGTLMEKGKPNEDAFQILPVSELPQQLLARN